MKSPELTAQQLGEEIWEYLTRNYGAWGSIEEWASQNSDPDMLIEQLGKSIEEVLQST